jgi:hypothetical protein
MVHPLLASDDSQLGFGIEVQTFNFTSHNDLIIRHSGSLHAG